MPRKQSDVEKILLAKGFRPKDGDHNYFNYYSKAGKKTAVFTKTSHGAREIDDNLLACMAASRIKLPREKSNVVSLSRFCHLQKPKRASV